MCARRRNLSSAHSPKRFWMTDFAQGLPGGNAGLFCLEGRRARAARKLRYRIQNWIDGSQDDEGRRGRCRRRGCWLEADEREEVDLLQVHLGLPRPEDRRPAAAALSRIQVKTGRQRRIDGVGDAAQGVPAGREAAQGHHQRGGLGLARAGLAAFAAVVAQPGLGGGQDPFLEAQQRRSGSCAAGRRRRPWRAGRWPSRCRSCSRPSRSKAPSFLISARTLSLTFSMFTSPRRARSGNSRLVGFFRGPDLAVAHEAHQPPVGVVRPGCPGPGPPRARSAALFRAAGRGSLARMANSWRAISRLRPLIDDAFREALAAVILHGRPPGPGRRSWPRSVRRCSP